MTDTCRLFIVDDVLASRRIVESVFGERYQIETFASAAACIERMTEQLPDIFLLDVDMPEMDGYSLCRHIRNEAGSSTVPVVFLSGLDDLESRLAGYDAGGNDFICKPFEFAELREKIEVLRRIAENNSRLRHRLDDSNLLTSLVMSNLDQYAVLVKFLRNLNTCEQYPDIAAAIMAMLQSYNLEGAVQFRLPGFVLTNNAAGEARPLEAAIIEQVRSLGTIAEFRNRAVFNFERVSLLVCNMPLADPDLCGSLKDYLAIAAETVDGKLLAMLTREQSTQTRKEISALLQALGATLHTFGKRYAQARYQGSETTLRMLADLDSAFASLGMREEHEESIKNIVQSRAHALIDIFDFSAETESTLTDLSARLTRTLGAEVH